MRKTVLIILFILLGLGLVPYKYPRSPDTLSDTELLVAHEETTCNADVFIVRGELNIPKELKQYFHNTITEFSIDTNGPSMFDPINENFGNWWLVSENQFIISGKVTSVDSSYFKDCKVYYPRFKIDTWSPTKYNANFWSFSKPLFYIYFIALFALLLVSVVLFFVRRDQHRNT